MENAHHLILTIDYEVFGNGSGSVAHCITRPADLMIDIAKRYDAPLTFFVEALECMAMAREKKLLKDYELIERQLLQLIEKGHDVQLHLHPQWNEASYLGEDSWDLDMEKWRIADLEEHQIADLFQKGKGWLQDLLWSTENNYCCNVFRAGSWCIQPSVSVIKSMIKGGMLIDSTVAPGFRNLIKGAWSDFRNAPDRSHWYVESDVCVPSKSGIMEVPITTGQLGRWRHYKAIRLSRSTSNRGMALGCYGSYQRPGGKLQSVLGKAGKLLRLGNAMLDFSIMPADVLIDITEQWVGKYGQSGIPVPIVAIAHTKNFTSSSVEAMDSYLEWANTNHIRFSTYGRWLGTLDAGHQKTENIA